MSAQSERHLMRGKPMSFVMDRLTMKLRSMVYLPKRARLRAVDRLDR
jgi:hypothetical protein